MPETRQEKVREERRGRRWVIRLAGAAAVLVALLLAAPLLIPADTVRDLVAARLSDALGRPVTIEAASAGILPRPGIELQGLRVPPGPDGLEADVAGLRLRLRWLPLLRREVEIDEAEILAPRLRLRLAAADTADAAPADTAAGRTAAPAASPVTVRIEELRIAGGAVAVLRPDGAPVIELAGLAERLSLLAGTGGDVVVVGTTSVDTVRLHLPAGTLGEGLAVTWNKDLRWEGADGRLKVITSELRLGDLPVAVTGEVTGLAAGAPVADLKLSGGPAELASLQGYLPAGLVPRLEGLRSGGTAQLEGRVAGPLAAGPDSVDWDVEFSLADGRLAHPDLPAPVRDIALEVAARPDRLQVTSFRARTERSRLDARGRVDDYLADPRVDFTVDAAADLAEAMALAPPRPDAPSLAGRVTAELTVRGRAADPAALELSGPLGLEDASVTGGGLALPVTGLAADGRLDGRTLHLRELRLRQGRSDYRISGTVRDPLALLPPEAGLAGADVATVELDAASRRLDVDQILAAGAQEDGGGEDGGAAGRAGPAASGPPAALDYLTRVTGTAAARVETLLVRGTRLTGLTGRVRVDRGLITIEEAQAAAYGGRATLAGTIDLADPRRGGLDLELQVEGARAEQYFAQTTLPGRLTRLAGALDGGVDVTATLRAALDDTMGLDLATLTSQGRVAVHDAVLAGLPLQAQLVSLLDAPRLQRISFADLTQPFRVEDGRLHVDGLTLDAGDFRLAASGWQALDGTLQGTLALTVPPAWAQGLRDRMPGHVADLLLGGDGPVTLPLDVTGRAAAPQVSLDTDRLAAAAADRAEQRLGRGTERLRQRAEDELTRGLQDLLGGKADTAATDSAAADSAAADSAGPESLEDALEDAGRSLLDRLKKKGTKDGG